MSLWVSLKRQLGQLVAFATSEHLQNSRSQFPLMPGLKTPSRLFLKYCAQVRVVYGQPEKNLNAVSYSCQHKGGIKMKDVQNPPKLICSYERNVVTPWRIYSHLSGGLLQSDCHVLWRICTCINMFFLWSTCRKSHHQTSSGKVKRVYLYNNSN